MESVCEIIYFQAKDGTIHSIPRNALNKYPYSYLTMLASHPSMIEFSRATFATPCKDGYTLDAIMDFYRYGIWPNPYINGNQLSISGVGESFDGICLFLGLPAEPFADPDEKPDVYPDISDQDDDFVAEFSEEFDDANDSDVDW